MASIRKRGDRWQVQIRRKGQRLISKTFLHRKDAEAWARHKEVQADRRELPNDPRILDRITLGELVVRYRDTVSIRKRGCAYEKIILNAFLRHEICARRLSELSASHFAAYRDQRLQQIKPSSLRRQLNPIRNLFEVAREEWGLPLRENPLKGLRLNSSDQRRERRLKEGELERLIAAARSCRNPLIVSIIQFAVETGMRRGEILAMRWDHLNVSDQSLLIPHTKNGHSRIIPLSRQALCVLQGVSRSEERVFPISANAFQLRWQRTKKRARLKDLHFQDFRHEALSRFFEIGLSTPEVALLSGHRDMRMLFRYAHPLKSQISKKLKKDVR